MSQRKSSPNDVHYQTVNSCPFSPAPGEKVADRPDEGALWLQTSLTFGIYFGVSIVAVRVHGATSKTTLFQSTASSLAQSSELPTT